MNKDLALGGTTLAIAAGYYAMAAAIPESFLADGVGPQRLPTAYAVLLASLSAVLIIRALARRGVPRLAGARSDRQNARTYSVRRAIGLLVIGVVYLVIVPWLGYALSLAGLLATTICYQSGEFNRQIALVAASGAAVFWLLFVLLLRIPQPPGFWPALF